MTREPKVDVHFEGSPPSVPVSKNDREAPALSALRAGDKRRALGLCMKEHGNAVGRLCMALLGSRDEADDAVQDTFVAAHAAFDGFRGDGSLRAWLFGIARRRCARALERRGAARPVESEPGHAPGADELLEARRRADTARALLSEVRPSEREALLLRYVGELSFREVAEACGIDEPAARKRVSRALARLRELTEE
jgi:RNA polymerase sigma-70 factor (ECF subfamily)